MPLFYYAKPPADSLRFMRSTLVTESAESTQAEVDVLLALCNQRLREMVASGEWNPLTRDACYAFRVEKRPKATYLQVVVTLKPCEPRVTYSMLEDSDE